MIKDITTDVNVLSIVSESVTNFEAIDGIIEDLLDTAKENAGACAGLAASQIGSHLRICVYFDGKDYRAMVNPKIIARSKSISSVPEGCLSRPGKAGIVMRRHKWVKISEYDRETKAYVRKKYKGFTARIVQHELDHMNGKLI